MAGSSTICPRRLRKMAPIVVIAVHLQLSRAKAQLKSNRRFPYWAESVALVIRRTEFAAHGRARLIVKAERRKILLHRLSENRAAHPAGDTTHEPGKSQKILEKPIHSTSGRGPNISSRRKEIRGMVRRSAGVCGVRGCGTRGPKRISSNRSGNCRQAIGHESVDHVSRATGVGPVESITYSSVTTGSQAVSPSGPRTNLRAPRSSNLRRKSPRAQQRTPDTGPRPIHIGRLASPRWTSGLPPFRMAHRPEVRRNLRPSPPNSTVPFGLWNAFFAQISTAAQNQILRSTNIPTRPVSRLDNVLGALTSAIPSAGYYTPPPRNPCGYGDGLPPRTPSHRPFA